MRQNVLIALLLFKNNKKNKKILSVYLFRNIATMPKITLPTIHITIIGTHGATSLVAFCRLLVELYAMFVPPFTLAQLVELTQQLKLVVFHQLLVFSHGLLLTIVLFPLAIIKNAITRVIANIPIPTANAPSCSNVCPDLFRFFIAYVLLKR